MKKKAFFGLKKSKFAFETAMKKFSSYKNEKAVPGNQILNTFSEEIDIPKKEKNLITIHEIRKTYKGAI